MVVLDVNEAHILSCVVIVAGQFTMGSETT